MTIRKPFTGEEHLLDWRDVAAPTLDLPLPSE